MRIFCLLFVLLSSNALAQFVPTDQNTVSDIHLLAKDLRSNQRVLFVMFAPSHEDVERITAARLMNHASIHVAYLTNGEGNPDGEGVPYPNQVAARWREKAFLVAEMTGAGHTFLNLPYIDAASTPERVRAEWPADTVRSKWRKLIQDVKPDAVLIAGLEHLTSDHPIFAAFLADIASAAKRAIRSNSWVPLQIAVATGSRSGNRGTATSGAGSVLSAERSVRNIYDLHASGEQERRVYRVFDWKAGTLGETLPSKRLFPARRVPQSLSAIDSAVQAYSRRIVRLRSMPAGKDREGYLVPLVDIMQKIDIGIAQTPRDEDEPRRFLLDWKLALERIRGVLLGVRVWWSISANIVTERQVTHLQIDSVSGTDPKGRTEVFFPKVLDGWVMNESQVNHVPFTGSQEFRLFSMSPIPYDLPRGLNGLQRSVYQEPWYVFVVHQASTAEYSFSFRIDVGLIGGPRFSPEVLTPVVRAVDGEEVVFRLTNHSRDGVADVVSAAAEFVRSDRRPFRLFEKDGKHEDTLRLEWLDAPDGDYLVELQVGGAPVANLLARRFPVSTTQGKPMVMLGRKRSSALYPALRRLGYSVNVLDPAQLAADALSGARTILVDESIHLTGKVPSDVWRQLRSSADAGARVVVFSQRHDVIDASGLFPGVTFTPTFDADTSYSILLAGDDRLLREPNDLSDGTWEGWIYRVASNRIDARMDGVVQHARFEGSDQPVIFTVPQGRGTITYIDLNLSPQWANVLPSAYELLANIVEDEANAGEEK